MQKAPALSSCASRSRTALCVSLALLLLRAPDASSCPPVHYYVSPRIRDVLYATPLLISYSCRLSAELRLALCALDAGKGGTGLGFGVLALTDLKPNSWSFSARRGMTAQSCTSVLPRSQTRTRSCTSALPASSLAPAHVLHAARHTARTSIDS
jgi:hypothetical protein